MTSRNKSYCKEIVFPAALKKGDKIAILSPASIVRKEYIEGASDRISQEGFEPVLMPHVWGPSDGSFASNRNNRLKDLLDALENPDIKAILCARGGYGCCQLLPGLPENIVRENPKWIIGFSDVSALLAFWYENGVASVHGPMAKHLSLMPASDPCTEALFSILRSGGKFDYSFATHEGNREGYAEGILLGGNLAVLNDLSSTQFDLLSTSCDSQDIILFLEDINEPIYKVNRILWRLLLSGTLQNVKGIIFGQFTDYHPDANYSTMEDMIRRFINREAEGKEIPAAYNFPVGHTDENYPLVVGARVGFEVKENSVRLHTV